MLETLLQDMPEGNAPVDILDAIIVAMDLFISEASKNSAKRIFLVYNS